MGRSSPPWAIPILGGGAGRVRLGLSLALAVIAAGVLAAFLTGRAIAQPIHEMLAAADRFDPAGEAAGPVVGARGSDEVAVLGFAASPQLGSLGELRMQQGTTS